MTAHEIRAFDEMFDMIFDSTPAAIKQNQVHTSPLDHSIDLGKENNSDLISRLRRYSRRMKKTTEIDEILDRKKQEIASCRSDQELLDWAMREVFAESQRYADEAKQSRNGQTLELQPPAYSHLVAFLMRVFRDQYRDPYLALSIFEHAKSLSAASYVFGCSTLAYNELLQTRWVCFRDLQGVHDILQEMRTNGVEVDAHTRSIVENLRRQIGEENLWVNDNEAGAEEVWRTITKIDQLISRREDNVPKRRRWRDWKEVSLNDLPDDKWEFGDWTLPR
ncbi:hypothetical protein BDQ17DRAFT_1310936 [Cyathus striatus]|nr:hypothetical protein BDQ17DRAFT_1310936 [Cyathus striatus]